MAAAALAATDERVLATVEAAATPFPTVQPDAPAPAVVSGTVTRNWSAANALLAARFPMKDCAPTAALSTATSPVVRPAPAMIAGRATAQATMTAAGMRNPLKRVRDFSAMKWTALLLMIQIRSDWNLSERLGIKFRKELSWLI